MFIPPTLLQTSPAPFSDPDYIFEPKIDGHRLEFVQESGKVNLYTRHNNDCTQQYPELIAPFSDDIVLDGEVACLDPQTGAIDFESVMTRFQAKKADKINRLARQLPVTYVVFDVLKHKGRDLRRLPLIARKEILASLDLPNRNFTLVPFIDCAGEALFAEMEKRKMEGMVGKVKGSIYESRRSEAWQKVINWTYVDVYITGYRKGEFGWLAAVDDGRGEIRPVGIIELGVNPTHKKAFYAVSRSIVSGEDKNFVYIEPRIKARVKIRNWTKAGLLRDAAFVEFIF